MKASHLRIGKCDLLLRSHAYEKLRGLKLVRPCAMGVWLCGLLLLAMPHARAQTLAPAEQLSNELGCPSCHLGMERKLDLRERTPDLSHAGRRYNPAYLFDFLQHPSRVRHHLGRARMPNFYFDERESLALTLYLTALDRIDEQWKTLVPATEALVAQARATANSESKALLTQKLNCTQCHRLGSAGRDDSIDLATIGYRLQPEWVKRYLVAPYIYDGTKTPMPSFFFSFEPAQQKFEPMLAQPAETIAAITAFLFDSGKDKREALERSYARARAAFPEINASHGERIFHAQNCSACHRNSAAQPWFEKNAPDLSHEGARVLPQWLVAYLEKPVPLRPFGFYPGTGSRMPDFSLTNEDATQLAEHFSKANRATPGSASSFHAAPLSVFAKNKARALLQTKLACLGCHQLGEQGGRIGPSFNRLRERLQSDFVYRMMNTPQQTVPETIMPQIAMPQATRELLANFLLQDESNAAPATYLSLIDNVPASFQHANATAQLYLKNCAACHGRAGDGKGYNATFLPKTPTAHADAAYMATRPDDTLYDGIHAGGYILNKSQMMPPWGETLSAEQIQSLVRYLRQLCQCEGPSWSRDNP